MRFIAVTSFLWIFVPTASATVQIQDTLIFGEHEYVIPEKPMFGLWYVDERVEGSGQQKIPDFESQSTANHAGYEARFEIRDSKLTLRTLTGRIAGKERRNEEILPEKKFPVLVTWFSGKIHLCVGDFDMQSQDFAAVIIFQVEKGIVTKMEFVDRMKFGWFWPWNGIPRSKTSPQSPSETLEQPTISNQAIALEKNPLKLRESKPKDVANQEKRRRPMRTNVP